MPRVGLWDGEISENPRSLPASRNDFPLKYQAFWAIEDLRVRVPLAVFYLQQNLFASDHLFVNSAAIKRVIVVVKESFVGLGAVVGGL